MITTDDIEIVKGPKGWGPEYVVVHLAGSKAERKAQAASIKAALLSYEHETPGLAPVPEWSCGAVERGFDGYLKRHTYTWIRREACPQHAP